MRRTVRINAQIDVILDDDRSDIPNSEKVMALFLHAASRIPGAAEIKGGAKFTIGLDRESMAAVRAAWKKKR